LSYSINGNAQWACWLLHTWFGKPCEQNVQTHARYSRNLVGDSPRVCLIGCSRGFDRRTRHTVASAPVTCLRHSSNGRPRTVTRKFAQEQVLSDVRRRTIWATSRGSRARPHDSGSGPCMPRKSSGSRARPMLLQHPSISSTVTVGDDIIADSVSLLNVGSGMDRT
jgi:hypothetical protein